MAYPMNYPSVLLFNHTIYLFGGGGSGSNAWQFHQLRTDSPTLNPSLSSTNPTALPSFNPTSQTTFPSLNPTKRTISPTRYPTTVTNNPSFGPTNVPSSSPSSTSFNPTITPTTFPTSVPSFNPTITPTTFPTSVPSFNPTITPTTHPTFLPTIAPSYFNEGEVNEQTTWVSVPSDPEGELSDDQNNAYIVFGLIGIVLVLLLMLIVSQIRSRYKNKTMRSIIASMQAQGAQTEVVDEPNHDDMEVGDVAVVTNVAIVPDVVVVPNDSDKLTEGCTEKGDQTQGVSSTEGCTETGVAGVTATEGVTGG
eukprot:254533_1